MATLDLRILQANIKNTDFSFNFDTDFFISVKAVTYNTPNFGAGVVSICNINKKTSHNIIKTSSLFNLTSRVETTVQILAGRESTGASIAYEGVIYTSQITQPPDIYLIISCMPGYARSLDIITFTNGKSTKISEIAQRIASMLRIPLTFEATDDREITNFTYGGSVQQMLRKLHSLGNLDVFISNGTLYVKDSMTPLQNKLFTVSPDELVGIPTIDQNGITFTIYYDGKDYMGSVVVLQSKQYPESSGAWEIYSVQIELDNRASPWFYRLKGFFVNA